MKKLEIFKTFRFTKEQSESMDILKDYNVNIQQFMRDAYDEKLKRDWCEIKKYKVKGD